MSDSLTVLAQHLLPKRALTVALGALADMRAGALTTFVVRRFIAHYGVDMGLAAEPDPARYPTFNAFFTRALRAGARPLAAATLVSPVDGAVSQLGAIADDLIVQAKGHDYSLQTLLGGRDELSRARPLRGGHFVTIYLSPRDYHRLHMPCAGTLRRMVHVPGALYSVNPATARALPGLFAQNERVVCFFDDDAGRPFALALVGATVVGSVETVWHGVVNPPRTGAVRAWDYHGPGVIRLERGAEFGRFRLGSTIVAVFPPGPLTFESTWKPGAAVRMGEAMADRSPSLPDAAAA